GVPVAYPGDRAGGHRGDRLAVLAGEPDRGGVLLYHLPQWILGELFERPALPVAVPALDEPLVVDGLRSGQRQLDRLPAAYERAGHHGSQREVGEPLAGGQRVVPAGLVEPGRLVAGQRTRCVAGGTAVPQEDDGGHRQVAASAPAARAIISAAPRATRYQTKFTIEWCATNRSSQAIETYATTK